MSVKKPPLRRRAPPQPQNHHHKAAPDNHHFEAYHYNHRAKSHPADYLGAGTTAVVGDKVAINVSYDTGILSAFDYSSKDFADRSRMLIDSKLYGSIVYKNSVLYLLVQSSDMEISDQHISAAISGKSKYSLFHPEETLRIPMNLALLVDNKSLNTSSPVTLSDDGVEVELPAPKSAMGSNYTFVAAEFDENGITGFLDTFVEDGI